MRSPTRKLTVLAQDPAVVVDGSVPVADIEIPEEPLSPGPRGYRVYVIDYDASHDTLYAPARIPVLGRPIDELLRDPAFHAQHVYGVVTRTLACFEEALGRKVAWSFDGHQLMVAPHAFEDPNAFYSKRDRALYFGYFTGPKKERVFTCLSYDVVAHETTHAILDGLRGRYTFPSSPDQAAFHEGFADAVALLSVFSLPDVVERFLIAKGRNTSWVHLEALSVERLKESALFGLGESLDPGGRALRRSVKIPEDPKLKDQSEFLEPHRRGELFVASLLGTFLRIWRRRIEGLSADPNPRLYVTKVAEEGQAAAEHLLRMVIRAVDYAPATDLLFGDFLSALLTSDREIQPDDSRYHYRDALREGFAAYGFLPASKAGDPSDGRGYWEAPNVDLDYAHLHFEALRQDRDEVFRFLWQNRTGLGLSEEGYTRVHSLQPCARRASDGAPLRETVAEYHQILDLTAGELVRFGLQAPKGMPERQSITLYGGGALIFNEFGALKYHVRNRVLGASRQNKRLRYLWESGYFQAEASDQRFADMHRRRFGVGLLGGGVSHAAFF